MYLFTISIQNTHYWPCSKPVSWFCICC